MLVVLHDDWLSWVVSLWLPLFFPKASEDESVDGSNSDDEMST